MWLLKVTLEESLMNKEEISSSWQDVSLPLHPEFSIMQQEEEEENYSLCLKLFYLISTCYGKHFTFENLQKHELYPWMKSIWIIWVIFKFFFQI